MTGAKRARCKRVLLGCVVASAGMVPSIALAQSAPGSTSRQPGPALRAGLDATYFSNMTRSSEAEAAARGLSQSDVRITPKVDLDIIKRIAGRHTATLAGSVGYDINMRNTRLNRERVSLDAGLDLDLPVCDTGFEANFARRQSDLGDFPGNDPESGKNAETFLGGSARVTCGSVGGLRPTAAVRYQTATNTLASRTFNDHDVLSYTGGLMYQSVALGEVTGLVRRTEVRFPNQPLAGGSASGFDSTAYGVAFSRNIGARLSANAELTYAALDSRLGGTPGFRGMNWDVSAKLLVGSRLELTANTSRLLSTSLLIPSNYNISSTYSWAGRYALTGRVTLEAGYTHLYRRFIGPTRVIGTPLTRDLRDTGYIGARYSVNRRIALRLRATRDQRTGGGPAYDFVDYRALSSIDVSL
ncbi:hypothetical protein [Novosphingobium sp.]|uniref:hypothetical protein n=1 Tax=Novosphingobium sp. TaxID=1874826 RepID=UPI00261AADC1|nr:hypothetical protein [Novosphingobium sp.]